MSIKPIYDRLVVKREETEAISSGGIVLVYDEAPKQPSGVVLAVGKDVEVSTGDRIVFSKNAGMEVKVDGGTVLVMRESDVIAVID